MSVTAQEVDAELPILRKHEGLVSCVCLRINTILGPLALAMQLTLDNVIGCLVGQMLAKIGFLQCTPLQWVEEKELEAEKSALNPS